ncbi:invasion associated locus B family protein [Leisingera daeponensis]|uniref:invasion associated locus B family protein n=1 Tax=Leisingera daeponensis TaxID=405746 RepID=UPI0003F863E6|nr:invasion associated locus B family protein [Leisingera daeponensis]
MRILLACLALAAAPALAQDRAGHDTASDWRVKHYESFGIWTSACDEREEANALVQRCYIRWVDVFSPRPRFAGQFLFLTPHAEGWKVSFGIEPGTLFSPRGFRIERQGEVTWRSLHPGCLTGLSCSFTGAGADKLIAQMREGGAFRFTFRDRHGQAQDLTWPLEGFDAAFADFRAAAKARSLLE